MLAELIKLTLNHGVYTTRVRVTVRRRSRPALAEWQPHLVVLDMDLDGMQIIGLLGARTAGGSGASAGHRPDPAGRSEEPSWPPSRPASTTS